MQDSNNLLKILIENKIDFIVIGGFAAVLYGSSHVTKDLDVCVPFSPACIEKLRQCLAQLHPRHRMSTHKLSFLEHPTDLTGIKNVYLETDLGVLDVLGFVGGVGEYAVLEKHAITVEVFGQQCKVISIDDLIKAKKAMGDIKDLTVAAELELVKKEVSSKD